MRTAIAGLSFAVFASAAFAADTPPAAPPAAPAYPSPLAMSILGLSITAIAVIGARVSQRSSDTMMFMVLASLAVTAVMVAYADKVHSDHLRERIERLQQLTKPAGS